MLIAPASPSAASPESERLRAEAIEAIKSQEPSYEILLKLRDATAADDKDARTWFTRGAYELTIHAPRAALKSLDRAAALDPAIRNLQFFRGRALYDLRRYRQAVQAFEKESNQDGNPSYWFYRGLANKDAKRYRAALSDFEQSDKAYETGRAATQLHRGDILIAQGKRAEAQRAYQSVVTLDPKSPVSGTAEERLKISRTPVIDIAPTPSQIVTPTTPVPATPSRPFHVRAFAGIERDSNVARLDHGILWPAQLHRRGDLRAVLDARASYYFVQNPDYLIGVLGDARASYHRQNSAYDDALLGGSVFATRYLGPWRIGAELRYDQTFVNQDPYARATNGTFWMAFRPSAHHETLFAFRARYQGFNSVPLDNRYNRNGQTYFYSLSHSWRPWISGAQFFEIEPGIRYAQERTHGAYFDNNERAAFVTVRYFKDLGPGAIRPTLFEAGLFYYQQRYVAEEVQRAVNLATGGNVREDDNFVQFVRIVQPLTAALNLDASYRHTTNWTTVWSFGHDVHVWRLGLLAVQ
ncbi:MAG: tetratricopeptide repeat protein [Pseudorhodoplanes sp.]|uniref:tetratricopeptide repeat protein n=1 Tax=Pseudorhodoplanes sp. TaxID=1934341 RepID=UPI003D0C548B